jgi:hypothetical protein
MGAYCIYFIYIYELRNRAKYIFIFHVRYLDYQYIKRN